MSIEAAIAALILLAALNPLSAIQSAGKAQAPQTTVIYLMRHAEKVDESRDSELSEAGRLRTAALASMLRDVRFDAVYSTDFKRTRGTIEPLARQQGVRIDVSISPRKLADHILDQQRGKTVLVCGHSDTVPDNLRDLGLPFAEPMLAGFDDVFIVTLVHDSHGERIAATLQRLHSPPKP